MSTTGGGKYYTGDKVTLGAASTGGYKFLGWHKDTYAGESVSRTAGYTFTAAEDLTLAAVFQNTGSVNITFNASKYTVNGTAYVSKPASQYTWTKSKVEAGAVWYARAYLVYTNANGETVEVYGELYTATAQ